MSEAEKKCIQTKRNSKGKEIKKTTTTTKKRFNMKQYEGYFNFAFSGEKKKIKRKLSFIARMKSAHRMLSHRRSEVTL